MNLKQNTSYWLTQRKEIHKTRQENTVKINSLKATQGLMAEHA
jgi:hypothetical protein